MANDTTGEAEQKLGWKVAKPAIPRCLMSSGTTGEAEQKQDWKVAKPTIPRCFMSEKWCMGEKDICGHWAKREANKTRPKAFVIMDYNRRTDLIYETQIRPMLANMDTPFIPTRADTVMRTGYIVCQKICRPILMSDLVVVEISNINSNVLYELGLSVALERPVLLMAQKPESQTQNLPDDVARLLKRFNLFFGNSCYFYDPFEYIPNSTAELKKHIWVLPKQKEAATGPHGKVGILGCDHVVPGPETKGGEMPCNAERFQVTDALRAQMGTSLRDAICGIKRFNTEQKHEDHLAANSHYAGKDQDKERERRVFLEGFAKYLQGQEFPAELECERPYYAWMYVRSIRTDTKNFNDILNFIESCEYLMVDLTQTSDLQNAMNFFWIGYCHGRGKQVIPIEVYNSSHDVYDHNRRAFDIQGLYYFGYDITQPQKVCDQFSDLFYDNLLEKDLKEEARNVFWKPFFSEPGLRVFVGASEGSDKYSPNEWDYLTLAELNRYFSDAKPTLQSEIISPIYSQPYSVLSQMVKNKELDEFLRDHLRGHNCIIIGSPDVNVLTELVLAKAMNVEPLKPELWEEEPGFCGCVTTKKKDGCRTLTFFTHGHKFEFNSPFNHKAESPRPSCRKYTFCTLEGEGREDIPRRDDSPEITFHHSYGYFAYLDNPFSENKKIIILSGISGPATLALAQMLTGCKNDPDPLLLPFPSLSAEPKVEKQQDTQVVHLPLPDYKAADEEMFKKDIRIIMEKYGHLATYDPIKLSPREITVTFSTLFNPELNFEAKPFRRTDQPDMSIEILTRINREIRFAEKGQVVGAIVESLISKRNTGQKACWGDGRRVVSWRLADPPAGLTQGQFKNPFTITPLKKPQYPFPV